jgi:hypothetical protein
MTNLSRECQVAIAGVNRAIEGSGRPAIAKEGNEVGIRKEKAAVLSKVPP